ncbi:MAG: hypothetical protein HY934_00375 [Candidatus Firestonebacteria bacterium]|nr:hypothetical protein [Candidatus Firestonebacteria bacterium]
MKINNKILFIIVFLFITISVYAGEGESLLNSGKILYEDGDCSNAIGKLQSALYKIDNYEKRYEAYLYLGLCYYLTGDYMKSNEAFKEAIKIKPSNKLDPKIYSPKILEFYEKSREDIGETYIALILKNYIAKLPDKKSSIALEYQDFLRIIYNEIKNEKISSNYRTLLLKYEYGFAKLFSMYLKAGETEIGLPSDYGRASFVYGIGTKIDIIHLKNFNLDIRADHLDFNNKKDNSPDQWRRREIKWQENQTGAVLTLFKYFYIGIYDMKINGKLDYFTTINNEKESSSIFKQSNDSKQGYLMGIRIAGEKYFLESELHTVGKQNNSLRVSLGRYF